MGENIAQTKQRLPPTRRAAQRHAQFPTRYERARAAGATATATCLGLAAVLAARAGNQRQEQRNVSSASQRRRESVPYHDTPSDEAARFGVSPGPFFSSSPGHAPRHPLLAALVLAGSFGVCECVCVCGGDALLRCSVPLLGATQRPMGRGPQRLAQRQSTSSVHKENCTTAGAAQGPMPRDRKTRPARGVQPPKRRHIKAAIVRCFCRLVCSSSSWLAVSIHLARRRPPPRASSAPAHAHGPASRRARVGCVKHSAWLHLSIMLLTGSAHASLPPSARPQRHLDPPLDAPLPLRCPSPCTRSAARCSSLGLGCLLLGLLGRLGRRRRGGAPVLGGGRLELGLKLLGRGLEALDRLAQPLAQLGQL